MKSKSFLTIAVVIFSIVFVSCQSSGTKDKKVGTLESGNVDTKKLKAEIVDIIMSLPDNSETVKLINETGAAYVAGLTLEDLQSDNLLTRAASAKAYGGVLFDMAYANTYNQVNTFSKLLDLNESLIRKLGFEDFVNEQKELKKRYDDNKDNRDSIDQIVSDLLASSNDYIQEHGSPSDISLVFAGATTKSLYVISNITLLAMNNAMLIDLMEKQKDKVASAIRILEMAGNDEEVQKMAAAIKPVFEVFSESESFDIKSVEKIAEMTSFVMK